MLLNSHIAFGRFSATAEKGLQASIAGRVDMCDVVKCQKYVSSALEHSILWKVARVLPEDLNRGW